MIRNMMYITHAERNRDRADERAGARASLDRARSIRVCPRAHGLGRFDRRTATINLAIQSTIYRIGIAMHSNTIIQSTISVLECVAIAAIAAERRTLPATRFGACVRSPRTCCIIAVSSHVSFVCRNTQQSACVLCVFTVSSAYPIVKPFVNSTPALRRRGCSPRA
jgi:hypothetical protein